MINIPTLSQPCIRITGCLGDVIYATPLIRYFSKAYKQKVFVETDFPELFRNSPFVEWVFDINKNEKCPDQYHKLDLNEYFTFPNKARLSIRNMYITDFWSSRFGFIIPPDKKTLEFYPNDYDFKEFDPIGTEYICINPSITDACREWGLDNWTDLVKIIEKNSDIKIVVTGKSIINDSLTGVKNKSYHKLEGENVIDLTDKLTISDWHHIIKNSKVFITHNSSGLPMVGTTDTDVIYLGGAMHPHFRVPFRNGSQSYKLHYVHGRCRSFCHTDHSYNYTHEDDYTTLHRGFNTAGWCYEGKPTFECHPGPIKVWGVLENLLPNGLEK